jgi:hypothetical protein
MFQGLTRFGGVCSAVLLYVVGFEEPSKWKLAGIVLSGASLAVLGLPSSVQAATHGRGGSRDIQPTVRPLTPALRSGIWWALGCIVGYGIMQLLNTAASRPQASIAPVLFATSSNIVVVLFESAIAVVRGSRGGERASGMASTTVRRRLIGELRHPLRLAILAGCVLGCTNLLGYVCLLTAMEQSPSNASVIIAIYGCSAYVALTLYWLQRFIQRRWSRSRSPTTLPASQNAFLRIALSASLGALSAMLLLKGHA